jgi:RNA polymerase sigma-70 factor (ECF subfamily)
MADDHQLLKAAQQGSREAFDDLILAHQVGLRAFVARFLPDPDTVFEIAQEVFIIAWRKRKQIDPERDLGRWLRGVARNAIADHLRSRARHQARTVRQVEECLLDRLQDPAEERAAERAAQRAQAMRHCLGRLSDEQRTLLDRRYAHGTAVQDLAEQLKRSPNAVSMLLLRVRNRLRRCVEGFQEGDLG